MYTVFYAFLTEAPSEGILPVVAVNPLTGARLPVAWVQTPSGYLLEEESRAGRGAEVSGEAAGAGETAERKKGKEWARENSVTAAVPKRERERTNRQLDCRLGVPSLSSADARLARSLGFTWCDVLKPASTQPADDQASTSQSQQTAKTKAASPVAKFLDASLNPFAQHILINSGPVSIFINNKNNFLL